MKNIHVLPTDKPSRLIIYSTLLNEFRLLDKPNEDWKHKRHIYITSDEEIKEGDYWIYICPINGLDYGDNNNPIIKNNLPNNWFEKLHDRLNYKKIILTDNKDLIKDGVQAIDDEFLEWFVKNPNCEEVETILDWYFNDIWYNRYKIIIPKEEPKQENKNMKTLWKRLSKENRNKLKVSAKEYPNATGQLIKALKTECSYISLSFECIIWLMQETTKEQTTVYNVDKLFDEEI